ncbi:MAG: alkylmercury lyase [Spirochaetales bacterium]|nr:alkylmercury lyase [Spirochaetales bacterium]
MKKTGIEFQYFKGCPNASATVDNLRQALTELNLNPKELTIVEIPDFETSALKNFQGSPTVLIEGKDAYTESVPQGSHYTCRLFQISGVATGVLPVTYLKEKLQKLFIKSL